jgi:hypothetical protein
MAVTLSSDSADSVADKSWNSRIQSNSKGSASNSFQPFPGKAMLTSLITFNPI